MKDLIKKEEIEKMNRYGSIYTVMLIATVVSAVPLFVWLGVWAFIPWGIIWAISLYFAFKVEKIKKKTMFKRIKRLSHFPKESDWTIYRSNGKSVSVHIRESF